MELPFRARDFAGGLPCHTSQTIEMIELVSPTHETSKKPSLCLDFIIVGGGIAGLAAAYALATSGHRVQVFEQARSLSYQLEPGGVHLPPNATRILTHWGVGKELLQKAATTRASIIIDLKTGKPLGQSEWQTAYIEEIGSSYYMMHHADLIEILIRLASSAGARLNFGVTVESVEAARETPPETYTPIAGPASRTFRPSVRLKTGETLHADIILGADGRRSMVRDVVTDEELGATSYGISRYTGSVSMTEVHKHAALTQLVDVGLTWPIWFGDMRGALAFPVRQHSEFIVEVWWKDSPTTAEPNQRDTWEPMTSLNSLGYQEMELDPRLRHMLDRVDGVSRQAWCDIPLPETWVDDSETIALIGEAAHPQVLGTLFGPALALEDAALLGRLFTRLRSADQIAPFLYAHQDLRKARADTIAEIERHNVVAAHSGPARITGGLVRWNVLPPEAPDPPVGARPSDAELAEIWQVWGYCAIDAADEWWAAWGSLREAAKDVGPWNSGTGTQGNVDLDAHD